MRSAMNLTARTVQHLKPSEKAFYQNDTTVPGLSLRVGAISTGGAKSWSLRYRVGRVQRRLTLGG